MFTFSFQNNDAILKQLTKIIVWKHCMDPILFSRTLLAFSPCCLAHEQDPGFPQQELMKSLPWSSCLLSKSVSEREEISVKIYVFVMRWWKPEIPPGSLCFSPWFGSTSPPSGMVEEMSWNQRSQNGFQSVSQVLSKGVVFPFMSIKWYVCTWVWDMS